MERDFFTSRIRLRHLHCFVSIAQEQHIGRAAAKLGLTQPAVSKTLTELEELTGNHLVDRGRHGAHLTPQGERFLPHAIAALEALHAAGEAASGKQTQQTEILTIGALPTVATDLLPTALIHLQQRRPHATVQVKTAANRTLLTMLKAGEIDCALARMADPDLMAGVSFEMLYMEPLVLAVRSDHPLLQLPAPSMPQVLDYPAILSPRGTVPRHHTESFLQSRGLRPPSACLETLSVSLARQVVLLGNYVWFVPIGAVKDDLARKLLCQLPIRTDGTEEPIGLLLRGDAAKSQLIQELTAVLRTLSGHNRSGPG